jgi:hypothetical protein
MQQIISYLKWLFTKTKEKPKDTETEHIDKENYIGMLSFHLTEDTDIDVQYALPKVDNIDIKRIPELAEKYASFLMAINDGYLRDHIIQMVEDNLKKNFNPNEILFWDNVITSWAMKHVEAQEKKQKPKKDQPLIKPLSVFNASGL